MADPNNIGTGWRASRCEARRAAARPDSPHYPCVKVDVNCFRLLRCREFIQAVEVVVGGMNGFYASETEMSVAITKLLLISSLLVVIRP